MFKQQRENFVIQVRSGPEDSLQVPQTRAKFNLSSMKLFDRFRKIVMRLVFALPSRGSTTQATTGPVPRRRSCDHRPEPPKTSCSSSYYSSSSHYDEAIADCIEFFNKSSEEGRKSIAMV
ncbi:hypothetical protein Acr_00g0043100 [Actinidia rufa]|uniref:Uncharacterized protein n=1 Tax=Actinidia rufa TaxID=165716 RepID=A0A7J0DIK1_9ERIC|nr:hypothetical protein Acr_00g0043100 [Actinidia rufa]